MTITVALKIAGTEILNDGRRESLEELIGDLRELGYDGEIRYRPPTGRGVSWWEAVSIFVIGEAGKTAIKIAVESIKDAAVKWGKRRLESDEPGASRPKQITIFGPDDKPMKVVRITKDGVEEEDQ